jgi:transposase
MHLVAKQVNGHEYYYLVEKERHGHRVITARTVYVGNRQKLAELLQVSASSALPTSFTPQEVGASLALVEVSRDLTIEKIIDEICPVRSGAVAIGRQILLAAVHRALAPRRENGLRNLREFYANSALKDLLPISGGALDAQRVCETLASLTSRQMERIESGIVHRLIESEGIRLKALAFDTTNFDSYAGATTRSWLLRRGHAKSGRPLRVLGLGLLVTEDEGIPLLTFTYPGNENDVAAFGRFLKALDRRHSSLALPMEATIAADGGNISKEILRRLEEVPRHYVLRLPAGHVVGLPRERSGELPMLAGERLEGKVRARKHLWKVYGVERCVVDVYSRRMHQRQLAGLVRDRKKALADLKHLQEMLERQRQGLRHVKPITMAALRRRVAVALAREHMRSLFRVRLNKAEGAPTLDFEELPEAWQQLEDYVLGRTLLVSNRKQWSTERLVLASRQQCHNEHFFRDLKDPGGVSMLPLRHRRDASLRANALLVVLALVLVKVVKRRLRKARVKVPSVASLLSTLKKIQRARLHLSKEAPPALRSFTSTIWVPSERTQGQSRILAALGLDGRAELGTTLKSAKNQAGRAKGVKKSA